MENHVIEFGKVYVATERELFTFLAYLPRIEVRIKRPSSILSPFLKPSVLSGKICHC